VIGGDIFVLALGAAVIDLPNRVAELEPQFIHEAELLARRMDESRATVARPKVSDPED
jgi:hypothetical protein